MTGDPRRMYVNGEWILAEGGCQLRRREPGGSVGGRNGHQWCRARHRPAHFYTRDMARLVRVAEQLGYGLVGANDAAGYTHEIPFGGFKESGLDREGGHEGIEEYTEVKSVVVSLG